MIKDEKELKSFLQNINDENIFFKEHFYEKKKEDRLYLDEKLIINSLKDISNFQGFRPIEIVERPRKPGEDFACA